nr:hypothetical protein [Mesorhizobium sp.]
MNKMHANCNAKQGADNENFDPAGYGLSVVREGEEYGLYLVRLTDGELRRLGSMQGKSESTIFLNQVTGRMEDVERLWDELPESVRINSGIKN